MANLPKWAQGLVTMEGWKTHGNEENLVDFAIRDCNQHPVFEISVDAYGGVYVADNEIADFNIKRLAEAIHHAENIARAIQAAQSAAEVQGG